MKALAWLVLVAGTLNLVLSWTDQLRAVRKVIRDVVSGLPRRGS